ncbi:MAG: hypothetical protein ACKO0W_09070 [Planctomycetota bacterium]
MTGLYWIIAIVVLQAVIGGLAKKAQEKNEAARRAASTQPTQPQAAAQSRPKVLARGAGAATPAQRSSATPPKRVVARAPKPPVVARGSAVKRPTASTLPAVPPMGSSEREEAAALRSRARVDESVARVRAAEARVGQHAPVVSQRLHSDLGRSAAVAGASLRPAAPILTGVDAASIRGLFRDPKRLREAFIASEVLRRPAF